MTYMIYNSDNGPKYFQTHKTRKDFAFGTKIKDINDWVAVSFSGEPSLEKCHNVILQTYDGVLRSEISFHNFNDFILILEMIAPEDLSMMNWEDILEIARNGNVEESKSVPLAAKKMPLAQIAREKYKKAVGKIESQKAVEIYDNIIQEIMRVSSDETSPSCSLTFNFKEKLSDLQLNYIYELLKYEEFAYTTISNSLYTTGIKVNW